MKDLTKQYRLIFVLFVIMVSLTLIACGPATEGNTSETAATTVEEGGLAEPTEAAIPEAAEVTEATETTGESATMEDTSVATETEMVEATEATTGTEATGESAAMEDEAMMGEFDQMYIDMMVPHHQSATEMAQIAVEQAENAELKQMAQQMIDSQQAEIDQMRQWREQWYGSSETPPMTQAPMMSGMEGMGEEVQVMDMTMDIEELRNAPPPIDLAFIEKMIPHHQTAIDASQMALEQAIHPELKEMAQKVIEDQQREIDDMTRIREELAQ